MIDAGSSELNQKWKNVLHNQADDYIVPESDVMVECPYDCISVENSSITASRPESYCDINALAISRPDMILNKKKIATFEWNYWVLDGTFDVIDTDETVKGYVSTDLSNENGVFTLSPFVFFDSNSAFPLRQNQTLKFSPLTNEVPAEVVIQTDTGSGLSNNIRFNIEETLENDTANQREYIHLFSSDIDTSNTAYRTVVIFTKSLMPYRKARLSEYNNGYKFFLNKYDLQSFVHTRTCKLTMEELPQNDLEISFADLERVFDSRYINAPFHISFDKTHRFYVFYGYNFDDVGWSYVWADTLMKSDMTIDRQSLVTTLKLESTFNSHTGTYGASNFKTNAPGEVKPPPFDWNDFNGFLMSISQLAIGQTDLFYIGNQSIPHWEESYSSWQPRLRMSYNLDEGVSSVPLKEMAQQISALLGCVMVRQPNEKIYLKKLYQGGTFEWADYIDNINIFAYPEKTLGENYKEVYISTAKSWPEQSDDENSSDGAPEYPKTFPPYQQKFVFDYSGASGEVTLNETVISLGYFGESGSWSWSSNLWEDYASIYRTSKMGTTFEFSDVLLNPLLQVGDYVYSYINSGYNAYMGAIEKIEINYDGSFRGALTINSAGFPEGD